MSSEQWDNFIPLIDGGLGSRLELPGDFSSAAEKLDGVSSIHAGRVYSVLDKKVKPAVSSSLYRFGMDKKPIPGWGARIRARRKEMGLTLEQVAKAVGATKSAVSQWEREESKDIKAGYVQGLSDLYKKPASWIIGHDLASKGDTMLRENKPIKPVVVTDISPARLDLVRMYGRLPDEVRGPIRMLIESLAAMHSERYAQYERDLAASRPKPPRKPEKA